MKEKMGDPVTGDLLVVDDNQQNLSLLSRVLKEKGHKVRLATDGRLALQAIAAKPPDLVLLDIKMPGMNGYEVLENLTSTPDLAHIPVIVISILSEGEDIVRAFKMGCVDYITKPFRDQEVFTRLETHLKLKRYREELEKANEALEDRVLERTEELMSINRQLQRQIVEKEQAEARLLAEQRARLRESERSRRALLGILEDQKRAQEALKKSEEKFRNLVENLPIGIVITTPEGTVGEANPAVVTMLGYDSKEELLSMNAFKHYVDPADRSQLFQAVSEEPVRNFEVQMKRKDGTPFWMSIDSISQSIEGGALQVLTALHDITERKQMEAELRIGEERFRSLMQHTAEGFYLLETPQPISVDAPIEEQIRRIYRGSIVECNDAQARMYGYSEAEEVMGKTLVELHGGTDDPENIAFLRAWIEARYRISGAVSSEFDRDEKAVWFSNNVVGIVEENQLIRIWGTQTDVTEMMRAEEALREKDYIIESASSAIATSDLDGKMTYANPVFLEMWGIDDPDELLGKPLTEYWMVADRYDELMLAIHDEGKWTSEVQARRKDGSLFDVQVSGALVRDRMGNPVSLMSSSVDITARKQAEEELKQYQQQLEERVETRTADLKAANQELEAFAYSVSHDLRAPLRAIHGFTRILMDEYVGRLDDEGMRIGSIIQDNAQKMGQLIDDLLSFSRMGRAVIRTAEVDMTDLANSVYQEASALEDRQRITFTLTELPPATADPNMMRQVWVNLISNAIKYSSQREQVVISVSGQEANDMLVYRIEDNGAGFDMKYQDKLFGVFQRLHNEKEFAGTGVGLALVQRVIQRHGGRIWAQGQVNKGATFYFSLPKKA